MQPRHRSHSAYDPDDIGDIIRDVADLDDYINDMERDIKETIKKMNNWLEDMMGHMQDDVDERWGDEPADPYLDSQYIDLVREVSDLKDSLEFALDRRGLIDNLQEWHKDVNIVVKRIRGMQ